MQNYKKDVNPHQIKDVLQKLANTVDCKADLVAANVQFLTTKGLVEVQIGDGVTIKELLTSATHRNNVKIQKDINIKLKAAKLKKKI